MKPVVFFGELCDNLPEPTKSILLPPGVKLLTLERWNTAENSSVLVRLENMIDTDIQTDLTELLSLLTFTTGGDKNQVTEMTLDGNQALEDMERLVWNTRESRQDSRQKSNGSVFTVGAGKILTLLVS